MRFDDLGAEHAVEQQVAGYLLVGRAGLDDGHVQAQPHAGRGVQPGVVALADVDQHEGGTPFGERVGHPELQRAHLVAAEGEAGQVVALDQHRRPAQRRGQLGARLQRRGHESKGRAWQAAHPLADLVLAQQDTWLLDDHSFLRKP